MYIIICTCVVWSPMYVYRLCVIDGVCTYVRSLNWSVVAAHVVGRVRQVRFTLYCMDVHTCIHTYMHTYIHAYVCTCMHAYVHAQGSH